MAPRACILGCEGAHLGDEERAFFRDARPWGFILFARNVESTDQLRRLTDDLRAAVDSEGAPVFVDQEGGRVQRLRPPLAPRRRPAALFGELHRRDPDLAEEAVRLNHRLLAHELRAAGFDADCAPCVDVLQPETHAIIGDRAFSSDPAVVAALGRAAVDGLLEGGVAPVIKHIPGHGRARADSHVELPVVDTPLEVLEETDFAPFRALADAPMAMTAHVTYTAVDPDRCATVSPRVVETVIRGLIGFDGLLMSDDLSMRALGGTLAERAKASLDAGCDVVLHGNGALTGEPVRDLRAELQAVAEASPELSGRGWERACAVQAVARRERPFDPEAAERRLADLGLEGRAA
ncbi:MAG: beta-N-acetylhexosaminidase [Caulobacteraceae bacterium]|nr:beta-N-acetylhexosaminidase [Caulobacter sp.]